MDDKDFFTSLFLEMRGILAGYLISNKVRFHDVDELISEIFFLAWKYRSTLRDKSKVKSWIFSITKNVLRAYKNNIKKHNSRFIEVSDSYIYAGYPNSKDLNFVLDFVERLPEKYRDVFILFYVEDKSIKEISEILGISESNCKIRLMRARKKLRNMLEKTDLLPDEYKNNIG